MLLPCIALVMRIRIIPLQLAGLLPGPIQQDLLGQRRFDISGAMPVPSQSFLSCLTLELLMRTEVLRLLRGASLADWGTCNEGS